MQDWHIFFRSKRLESAPTISHGEIELRSRPSPEHRWNLVSRQAFLGDMVAIELRATCSVCRSAFNARLTHSDMYHDSRTCRITDLLCHECWGRRMPREVVKCGLRRTDLQLDISLERHRCFQGGALRVFGRRRSLPPLESNSYVCLMAEWTDPDLRPALRLVYQCRWCRAEFLVSSTRRTARPPQRWTCGACSHTYEETGPLDVARNLPMVVHSQCQCFFCSWQTPSDVSAEASDARFAADGAYQCQGCVGIRPWAECWTQLRTVSKLWLSLFHSEPFLFVIDVAGDLDRYALASRHPSGPRLAALLRVPSNAIPLPLSWMTDSMLS